MAALVLHDHVGGNNQRVAQLVAAQLQCAAYPVVAAPPLDDYEPIVLVIPNAGDEELPPLMEDYLCGLTVRDKSYHLCELGNYFGFEDYVGCKRIAIALLDALNWRRLSDVSLDSLPALDTEKLSGWLQELSHA